MRNARRFLACACVVLVIVVMSIFSVDPTYSIEDVQDTAETNTPSQNPQFNVDAMDVGYGQDEFVFARTGTLQTSVLQSLTDNGQDLDSIISGLSYGHHELPELPSAEIIGADAPAGVPVLGAGGGTSGGVFAADYGQLGGVGSSGLGLIGINPSSFGFGSDDSSGGSGTTIFTTEQQIITIEPLVMTNGIPEVSAVPAPSAVLLATLGFGFLSALHKRCL